ncbi:uncharacterized protein LY89DRAFT_734064 [Mollisia scopiformis]|uniref:Uncharacterized protein n=1 Tax=Mollisia scopiformis TaxID=149040 RepID=A0A194XA75_MOLSC|nr:uncharacterized protein LY89DRAFT_734064 [Mollisia scopiformis]KUJ17073.1 hypothetical protein LY89DRAFT_734064 [Mollisia scopiformis]
MYEDDEFARSLRPAQDAVDRESRIFTAEDSEMMNMIFQYLDNDGDSKQIETKATKAWEPPRLDFDPALVGDFQRFADYNGSSQESSPSPSVSLFSEVSGMTTPRTLSNRSSRSPSGMRHQDDFRMTTKPADKLTVVDRPVRLTPSPPTAAQNPPTFENREVHDEASLPQQSTSPVAPQAANSSVRRHELRDPQEKRQNSYNEGHWPSMATIASKYERKGSRKDAYRHKMLPAIPPPMASGARIDELEELAQAVQPSQRQIYLPSAYVPQESKRSQDSSRTAHGPSRSPPLESTRAQSQRSSHEVSPSPYQPVYSPENSSARTYESRSSQNTFQTYRNPLPALPESGPQNVEPPYSPTLNRPQPPPTDPSLRRYESFKMAGASAGRYELKDPHEAIPVDEARNKSLDNLVGPKPSLRSRFSFPKPTRATITSFVDILPQAPPSPAVTPPGESGLFPIQLRIPTPDFSLPPRPPKKELPVEPLPSVLSIGQKDASTGISTFVSDATPSRSSSGNSTRMLTPSLTIQIPESTRPAPQKVDSERPGLSEALNKFKQDSMLARPRPKPQRMDAQDNVLVTMPMWNPPAVPDKSKIARTSDSILARPRPKAQPKFELADTNGKADDWRASAPAPSRPEILNVSAPEAQPTPYRPASVPALQANTKETFEEARPKPKKITFDESSISPQGYPLESAAPMIPAPNFSRTAHTYAFHSPTAHELQHAASQFEVQAPIIPRPLNIAPKPRDFDRESAISKAKLAQKAASQAKWFHSGFCASSTGLQMTMSRRVATFSKLEWAVESSDSKRGIRCFTQTNTLSRRTDFFDEKGERLFCFQRKTGSTRVGETGDGVGLFSVKNSSFGLSPYWVVELGAGEKLMDGERRWVARGNESLTVVEVSWGGFEVGRISVKAQLGKHTYTVDVSAEMNYAIMAALVTVFDDWRMDHAC